MKKYTYEISLYNHERNELGAVIFQDLRPRTNKGASTTAEKIAQNLIKCLDGNEKYNGLNTRFNLVKEN